MKGPAKVPVHVHNGIGYFDQKSQILVKFIIYCNEPRENSKKFPGELPNFIVSWVGFSTSVIFLCIYYCFASRHSAHLNIQILKSIKLVFFSPIRFQFFKFFKLMIRELIIENVIWEVADNENFARFWNYRLCTTYVERFGCCAIYF